jgi:hypothetical protein
MGVLDKAKELVFGTAPKTDYRQMSLMDEHQRPVWEELNRQAIAGIKGTQPISSSPYEQRRTAFTPEELAYYRSSGVNVDPSSGTYGAYGGPSTNMQQYWQNALAPELNRTWQETENKLNAAYAGPAYWSSGRAKATNRALDDWMRTRTRSYEDLAYGDYGRYLQGAGDWRTQAGGFADADLANKYSRWTQEGGVMDPTGTMVRNQSLSNPYVQLGMQLFGVRPHENIITQTPGTSGMLQAGARGFGQKLGEKLGGG